MPVHAAPGSGGGLVVKPSGAADEAAGAEGPAEADGTAGLAAADSAPADVTTPAMTSAAPARAVDTMIAAR